MIRRICYATLIVFACSAFSFNDILVRTKKPVVRMMETTGYCNCEKCCSWEYSWFGFGPPVYTTGKLRGKKKEIGITASGTMARYGTVAADLKKLPIGTIVFIAGFGWGRVEDCGGAIVGDKLDIWFSDHQAAKKWGRKKTPVKIWLPVKKKSAKN